MLPPAALPGDDVGDEEVDDAVDDSMAVDATESVFGVVKTKDIDPTNAGVISATAGISAIAGMPHNSFITPLRPPTIAGASSAVAGSSSTAGISSSALMPPPAAISSAAFVSSSAALFAEGVPDDHPADGDLTESEPSLEELLEAAPLLRAQVLSFVERLDSWCSLMEHHKVGKKNKKE